MRAFPTVTGRGPGFIMTTIFSRAPGWDWEVHYQSDDDAVETMLVFGKMRIEDAISEARLSLSFNIFRSPDFVEPAVLGARRISV